MSLSDATHIARSKGDPRVQRSGPSSLTGADKLARALGWFSVGLGVMELAAPGQLARWLGLNGKEGLIRAYGARELASAIPTLSVDKPVGLASRVAGDVLDLGTLASALHRDNLKRNNAATATALVIGVTLLDLVAYAEVKTAHRRGPRSNRDYSTAAAYLAVRKPRAVWPGRTSTFRRTTGRRALSPLQPQSLPHRRNDQLAEIADERRCI